MIGNAIILKKPFYKKLSNFTFIKSKKLPKRIGLGPLKWIVKNTFFKYFSQNLKLKGKASISELNKLRLEMTYSEISHLIGFVAVVIVALVLFIRGYYIWALIVMIINVFMNLYPSLLQQENKKRIDRLIKIYRYD